jgi:hypothetical protein
VERFQEAYEAVFINHHEKGSLMARMSNVEESQRETKESLKAIEEGIEALPGKLIKWLTILLMLLALFEFLAPSIKKQMGLADAAHQTTLESTEIPQLTR